MACRPALRKPRPIALNPVVLSSSKLSTEPAQNRTALVVRFCCSLLTLACLNMNGMPAEPWSASSVLRLNAEFREALRIMRAVDGFNRWLLHASGERAKAAVLAALGPSSDRISTLLDLPIAERHCPSNTAPAP